MGGRSKRSRQLRNAMAAKAGKKKDESGEGNESEDEDSPGSRSTSPSKAPEERYLYKLAIVLFDPTNSTPLCTTYSLSCIINAVIYFPPHL